VRLPLRLAGLTAAPQPMRSDGSLNPDVVQAQVLLLQETGVLPMSQIGRGAGAPCG
jgi:hypothetical protein